MIRATHLRRLLGPILGLAVLFLGGCTSSQLGPAGRGDHSMASMTLTSDAFGDREEIPRKYTGQGRDISPPLRWTAAPAGAAELALIVDDPDAPDHEPFVHWVLAKIPAAATALSEGASSMKNQTSPPGMVEGVNNFGGPGYAGPMPPPGKPHRYFFRLYALDQPMNVQSGLTKAQLLAAMRGHVLAQGELMGTYQRK